jgi:hypothetical protein
MGFNFNFFINVKMRGKVLHCNLATRLLKTGLVELWNSTAENESMKPSREVAFQKQKTGSV